MRKPLSKQALSKYETEKSEPSSSTIMDLAQALGVKPSFFFEEPSVSIDWIGFRKHASLPIRRKDAIAAIAEKRLETEIRLRELFQVGLNHKLPKDLPVGGLEDAETAADRVRLKWKLGNSPINGVVETIEDNGGIVLSWQEVPDFSGRSGWTGDGVPVMVINSAGSVDKRRFDAAHELGHLVMQPSTQEDQYEGLAYRFAGAFLVPRDAVIRELGVRRRRIALQELGLLKQRWGLSMQAWARRAKDLSIIDQAEYKNINIQIRRNGWYRQEPYAYEGREEPILLARLVSRAVSEGIMSSREADELRPGHEKMPMAFTLRELARQPREERLKSLINAKWAVDLGETTDWDAITCSPNGADDEL